MKYRLIGDCHGKIEELLPRLSNESNRKTLQLGDMGLGFRGVNLPNLHIDFGFIRGNHDAPDQCRMHHNYAGEFGYWNGIFVIGGAYSIDYAWRIPGVSWWPNEELDEEQLEAALKLYIDTKPQIVASHEAPDSVGKLLLGDGFRDYKISSTDSRTAKYMQRMINHHYPKHWFFGHYHRDWAAELGGCKFQCLNELSVADITI